MWSADAAVFWQVSALFSMYGGRHSQPVHCYTCTAIGIFFAPLLFYVFFCSCLTFYFAPHARTFCLRRNGFCPPPFRWRADWHVFCAASVFFPACGFFWRCVFSHYFHLSPSFFAPFVVSIFLSLPIRNCKTKAIHTAGGKKPPMCPLRFHHLPLFLYSPPSDHADASVSIILASSAARVAGFSSHPPRFLSFPFSISDCGSSLSPCLFLLHFWRL